MRDYFKPKTWLITALMLMIAFSLSSAIVYFGFQKNIRFTNASASNNVRGWAWNANIGWISFNCTDNSPQCVNSNYGVSISSDTGHFSGYAWSSSVGWISFNETGAPDYAFNTGCLTSGSCSGASNCTACYNFTDRKVYGWGKILSLGDNGWIKFSGNKQNGQPWAPSVTIDPATGSVSGWAWNANDNGSGIGWISFNCANESPACSGTNYKVIANINRPPTVAGMTAPNWSYSQAAQAGALNAYLNWTFNDQDAGSSESAYQIIVNTTNSVVNPIFDSGKCLGAFSCTPVGSCDPNKCKVDNGAAGTTNFPLGLAMTLNYNTAYYWWIQVWDNLGATSVWRQYNSAQDTPLEADDGVALTFTTYKHKFPMPSATWLPVSPSRGEKVKFTDTSKNYTTALPTTAVPCDASNCAWLWTVPAGATIDDAATSTPTVIFNASGSNAMKLKVTDKIDGYWVEGTILVEVNDKLPKWKEVKPE